MAAPISRPVRFKKRSAKALVSQLAGAEPQYPVYRFGGNNNRYERPEVSGSAYRSAPPDLGFLTSDGDRLITSRQQPFQVVEA